MADPVGQKLGNYRLIRRLGRGGFAEVYLGEHTSLNTQTQVAVKVLDKRHDLQAFINEVRSFRLKHPHIIQLLDIGVEKDVPFLVMEYAPNGTVRDRYPKGMPLPLTTIVQYVQQVADALQYLHDQRLVHRDIKPQNLLLGRNNEVLLSDFGIAVGAHNTASQSEHKGAGTVAYMAPEQLQGYPVPASDQYSLGIMVYEWLCGERPFQGESNVLIYHHIYTPPPSLQAKMPTISPDIEAVVFMALRKDPKQRFLTVKAFANALEQACQLSQLRAQSQSSASTQTLHQTPAPPMIVQPPSQPITPPPPNQSQGLSPATFTPSSQSQGLSPATFILPNQSQGIVPPASLYPASPASLSTVSQHFAGPPSSPISYAPATNTSTPMIPGPIPVPQTVARNRKRMNTSKLVALISVVVVIVLLLVIVVLVADPSLLPLNRGQGSAPATNSPGTIGNGATAPSPVTTTPSSTGTVTSTIATTTTPSTSTPAGWHTLFAPFTPTCNGPGGTAWNQVAGDFHCTGKGLAVAENSNPFAELDLNKINGQTFNLIAFRAQVTATFQDPTDNFTKASLFIQMPPSAGGIGGYIFELSPFAGGTWTLLKVKSEKSVFGTEMVKSGIAGLTTAGQALTSATITAIVQSGVLTVYLNNSDQTLFNQVLSFNPSPSAFGLMVCSQPGATSSFIYFTNFEFDVPST